MKITREGCQLKIKVDSDIGYCLTFSHSESCDANAEAWRVHLQNRADMIKRVENEIICTKSNTIYKLENQVRSLRGTITRLKRKNKKETP